MRFGRQSSKGGIGGISGDAHVRIREGLGVKSPGPTRPDRGNFYKTVRELLGGGLLA